MSSLESRIISIENRIRQAAIRAGRLPEEITLVAVSKLQSVELVSQYCKFQSGRGIRPLLGENYVQEFRDKRAALPEDIECHLIGPLQRNKAKLAVSLFSLIQSVDSERLLLEINKEAIKQNKIQDVFLQVNISEDSSKAGFSPKQLDRFFLANLLKFEAIRFKGLMTITRLYDQAEQARHDFKKLKDLADHVKFCLSLQECCLSMGMSDDFEVAIEEGATHVRIGSALFGQRQL